MFTSWKCDPKDEDVVLAAQEIPFDPVTRRTTGVKACSLCRVKKLRCNGDKSGCQRCKTQGLECNYTDTVRRKRTGDSSATTASPKSMDHSDTQKASSTSTTTSSTAVSTSSFSFEHGATASASVTTRTIAISVSTTAAVTATGAR
ncbi:uncharacterized protein K460DRAFT_352518 [Cucurbitaria berberidis CBS 394.84]|uniref:Zn(2)-C6 fungal-type domain-containing protein n=1 Tax=Cucurbitaria berberidis CBS 394.84 TaxID=1168544 RepID=A0A9P4L9T6_9PLEO|nr:uncharacterized protein K460DRAFT_352518 [Cucurbitaria berberidis CBS 394.84]KAF1847370.1 hypothetical protein K460DRAFT_352518 [Cucurbitaria berberidis CBS 394.84]